MSVLSLLPNYWDNGDGLRVKFPGSARTLARGGAYPFGTKTLVECFIDLTAIAGQASSNHTIVLENVVFPDGAFIESVETLVTKETTGSSATLDLGLVKTDRSTELDFDGLLAAYASIGDGTDLGEQVTTTKGGTNAGALIGTVLAFDGIMTANCHTADFTAGTVRVRVVYTRHRAADL